MNLLTTDLWRYLISFSTDDLKKTMLGVNPNLNHLIWENVLNSFTLNHDNQLKHLLPTHGHKIISLFLGSTVNLTVENLPFITPNNLPSITSLSLRRSQITSESFQQLASFSNLTIINFDFDTFPEDFNLDTFTNLKSLTLSRTTQDIFCSLCNLTTLTSLSLSSEFQDSTPISSLQNLTFLNLSYPKQEGLTSLQFLTNLSTLDIYIGFHDDDLFYNIDWISSLTNLTSLRLQSMRIDLKSADNLKYLSNLTQLTFTPEADELSYLSSLPLKTLLFSRRWGPNGRPNIANEGLRALPVSLEYLYLSESDTSEGAKYLGRLENLTFLELNYCPDIKFLDFSNLSQLQTLRLFENGADSLYSLKGITSLRTLYLDHVLSIESGISHLSGFTHLEELDLYNENTSEEISEDSVKSLAVLTNLRVLRIKTASPDPLRNLLLLEELCVESDFPIEDPSFLGGLKNLRSLDFCYLTETVCQFLYGLEKLVELKMRDDTKDLFEAVRPMKSLKILEEIEKMNYLQYAPLCERQEVEDLIDQFKAIGIEYNCKY